MYTLSLAYAKSEHIYILAQDFHVFSAIPKSIDFGTLYLGRMAGMAVYGYHRVSTKDQHLDRGICEIQQFCVEHDLELKNIFTDQQTGKNFNRPRYMVLVEDVLREEDTLIVTELDRLGRNKRDTMEQIRKLQGMNIRLMVLELLTTLTDLSKMDNSMARLMMETVNNMMLELYASMAEAELEKKTKRIEEGLAMKKLRGEWDDYGRPPVIKEDEFAKAYQRVIAGEITQAELKKELGLSHTTFYRYRKKYFDKIYRR